MSAAEAPSRTIFISRHGEKPADPPSQPPPFGVDVDGNQDAHSLLPLGWQRAGALATLFAPFGGALRGGILTPGQLISPDYGSSAKTAEHRTYQTIYPLSQLIGIDIENPYAEGSEAELGQSVAAASSGVTLICWEHTAIPTIANNILPIAAGTVIPQTWPGNRFDVVWSFTLTPGVGSYEFSQVPQMLLAGDSDTPIPPGPPPPVSGS
jgi:hypothetical protein